MDAFRYFIIFIIRILGGEWKKEKKSAAVNAGERGFYNLLPRGPVIIGLTLQKGLEAIFFFFFF